MVSVFMELLMYKRIKLVNTQLHHRIIITMLRKAQITMGMELTDMLLFGTLQLGQIHTKSWRNKGGNTDCETILYLVTREEMNCPINSFDLCFMIYKIVSDYF